MYTLDFTKRAHKNFKKIPNFYQEIILEKLEALKIDPFNAQNVKILKGENNFYRLRVGDYRIIFETIEKEIVILVIDINHRKDIYR